MRKNGASSVLPDTPAGEQVKARLAEEKTLQALDHILARLDTVEAAIGKLAATMHQGPGMVAMVADMADEAYRSADAQGINVDQRLRNALQLAEQLTAPAMVEKLNQLTEFTHQIPGLVAMTGDMVDEAYRRADAQGVSIDERLGSALELAEKLTAPAMVAKLSQVIELSEQAPGLIAMTGDMVDEAYRRADARGVSIDERLGSALTMAEKLTDPTMVAKLDDLIVLANNLPNLIAMTVDTVDEGLRQARENGLEPEIMVEWATQFGRAMREAQETPAKKIGLLSMLTAMRDPDRQKAISFSLTFLKALGKQL